MKWVIYFFSMFLLFAVLTMNGCAPSVRYENRFDERSLNCTYTEKYQIQTEPPSSRVYIQDQYKGLAPVDGKINKFDFIVTERGQYPVKSLYAIGPMDGYITSPKRTGPTKWGYDFTPSNPNLGYTVKVFKEGYHSKEIWIQIGGPQDNVFLSSIKNIPTVTDFSGNRSLLIELEPIGTQKESVKTQNTQHKNGSEQCERAKQEYEAALRAYKTALKNIDDSQNAGALGSYGVRNNSPGTAKGLAGMLYFGSALANQDAKRDLREAEIRLEQARARMAVCN